MRPRRRRSRGRLARTGPPRPRREWVGGRFSPPAYIMDREPPYRFHLALWLELPEGIIIGHEMAPPEAVEGSLGRALLAALRRPLLGPRRRPDAIRVGDEALAAEVRAAVGDRFPVTVAPTPELEEVIASFNASLPASDVGKAQESYLGGGSISAAVVNDLFRAAQVLYRVAPWKRAADSQVLRVDIPALKVEGACVSIIGNLGQSVGLLIFPSLAGYQASYEAALAAEDGAEIPDLGSSWLALSFERGAELPASMRREIVAHEWPVAAADAYPRLLNLERDAVALPPTERQVKIVAACASALAAFCAQHGEIFTTDRFVPVSISYFNDDKLEVRITAPYEAFAHFTPSPAPAGRGSRREQADPTNVLEDRLVHRLMKYAQRRFGPLWLEHLRDFKDPLRSMQLAAPWSVYGFEIQGAPVVGWFLQKPSWRLSRRERAWLTAQQDGWLAIWEVVAVEPGESLTLREPLSLQTRRVRERTASRSLEVGDAILGRVIDHGGDLLLCGLHPCPLPPAAASDIVRRARGWLQRKKVVPVERLRQEAFGRYLIRRWEQAVARLDAAAGPPAEADAD